tara:strand:+ start:4753 stop:6273 length:1521 start_codon:yes stop_codon:yes gene_type:complete
LLRAKSIEIIRVKPYINKTPKREKGMGERFQGGEDLIEKYAKDRVFVNEKQFAEFLHKIEPRRGWDAWRKAIQRWVKKGNSFKRDASQYSDEPELIASKFYHDESNDRYICILDAVDGMYVVEGEKHRAMRRAYSKDGGNMTVDDMARNFDMPVMLLNEYVRIHGWRHAMDPFTDHEIKMRTVDDMVEEMIAMRRLDVMHKAEAKRWRDIEKQADAYRYLNESIGNEFKELMVKHKPKAVKPYKIDASGRDYAVVISPTDLHYGKAGWKLEVGEAYGFDEARERLLEKTSQLVSRLPGKPEKIYVTAGSDWFHVDNDVGQTTKGTPQDMAGSPAQILMQGCQLAQEHIDSLRAVAPIEIVFMGGNHDRHTSLMLMMYIDAYYKDAEDVNVIVSPHIRQYITYGNNLLGFTHGDGKVLKKLHSLMAHEARRDWGSTQNHMWFHGHLHHQQMVERGGCMIIQLPSLAGEDRYHARHGYTMARAGLCAHMIDKELGLVGTMFAPVMPDE